MKVVGHKKLIKQFKDLPNETHDALRKSLASTAKFGERKAKSIVPVKTGHLKSLINSKVHETTDAIYGFVNFHDGTAKNAIKVGAVNYGRRTGRVGTGTRLKGTPAQTGQTSGYHFIETVKTMIGERHKRAVVRHIDKALKDAMK